MRILFVHPQFPAQFGHVAEHLIRRYGFECLFASEQPGKVTAGIQRIQYYPKSGATKRNHYFSRTFENQIWSSHALFEVLKASPDIQPDLIVGHSGFVSTLYLRELYDCPIINYFEYYYRTRGPDADYRLDLPRGNPLNSLRGQTRNAIFLLDMENCDAGYSPTRFQRSLMPEVFQPKITTIFDGIDTEIWRPLRGLPRQIGDYPIPENVKVITYVSRGMESMRGFDIFMRMAKRICDLRPDVQFLVVGDDRVAYGGDLTYTEGKTFKEWVLAQDSYDLTRIRFLGQIPPRELAKLFSLTDLHVYWTVPFVLSWSLMNALACGAVVAASNTAPVQEMIVHEENGLLFDFFDIEQQCELVLKVLDDPQAYRPLAEAGRAMIEQHYSMEVCLPRTLEFYRSVRR